MPGRYTLEFPTCTFISAWGLHRAGLTASDDPAHPENVVALDLSKSGFGVDSQIWVMAEKVSGAGASVDISLVFENFGSLIAVQPYVVIGTFTLGHLAQHKFTGLIAGKYHVLVTVTPGDRWNIHVATNAVLK